MKLFSIFMMMFLMLGFRVPEAQSLEGDGRAKERFLEPSVLENVLKTIQIALETRKSGDSEVNRLVAGPVVSVTPTATWKSVSNHFCRSFVEVVLLTTKNKVTRKGVACREASGTWKLVGK